MKLKILEINVTQKHIDNARFNLPAEATRFISDRDAGNPTSPFSFTVALKEFKKNWAW